MNMVAIDQFTSRDQRTSPIVYAVIGLLFLSTWYAAGITQASQYVIAGLTALILLFHVVIAGKEALPPRLPLICALAILAYAIVAWLNPHAALDPRQRTVTPLSTVVTVLPSTVDAAITRDLLPTLTAGLVLMLIAATVFRTPAAQKHLIAGVAVLGATVALYIILQRLDLLPPLISKARNSSDMRPLTPKGPFRYHAHAATLIAVTLPFATYYITNYSRKLVLLPPLLFAAGAYATGSRIGFGVTLVVGLLCCVIYALATVRRYVLLISVGFLLLPAVAGVAVMMRPGPPPVFLGRAIGGARLIVWDITRQMVADRPIFGHGPGSYKVILPEYTKLNPQLYRGWIITNVAPGDDLSNWSVACNDLFQATAEFGAVGMSLFLLLIIIAVSYAWRATPTVGTRQASLTPITILLALLALSTIAAFDWPLYLPSIFLLSCTLLGACVAMKAQKPYVTVIDSPVRNMTSQ